MPSPKVTTTLPPISFADFRPGIADLPGINYKPETATRTNTYRCIANHSGALIPLPRRQTPFPLPSYGTPTYVTGIYVPPIGMLPATDTDNFTPDMYPEHELFVDTAWWDGANENHNLLRYRRFENPGTGFDLIKSTSNPQPGLPPDGLFHPSGSRFSSTRSNRASYVEPGCPVTIIQGFGFLAEFPDDQNQSSNTPFNIFSGWFPTPGALFILNSCTHQGRVVLDIATVYNHGPNAITFMGENLMWSWFNDVSPNRFGTWNGDVGPLGSDGLPTGPPPDSAFDTTPKVFIPENPSGFACMVSMSANELFFVKQGHGGGYATGSLDVPGIVSLPMVTGSEIVHVPAVCPIGVVYGNRSSGIWVWSHGDNSSLLSGQMIPDFWVVTPGNDMDEFGGISYSMASCYEWVLTPNNFLFDTELKSWWRLEDPAVTTFRWMTSEFHYIYGAQSSYTSTNPNALSFFKREDKAPTFSWQSHPIWQSVEDIVSVADIGLIAEGNGSVTLTLTALDGDTNSITIALDNCGFPERFRERLSIQGKYLQLRIESQSPNAFFPAPTVYSVTLYPFTEAPIGHSQ